MTLLPWLVVAVQLGATLAVWRGMRGAAVALAAVVGLYALWQCGFLLGRQWLFSIPGSLWLTVLAALVFYVTASLLVRHGSWRVGVFLHPAVLLCVVAAKVLPVIPAGPGDLVANPWLKAHVVTAIAAYGLFMVAACAALVALTRQAYLKARATSHFSELLPGLMVAERVQQAALAVGTLLLAIATVAGMVFEHRATGHWLAADGKSIVALASFIMAAALLASYWVFGLRGRRVAQGVLAAYLGVLVVFLMSVVF